MPNRQDKMEAMMLMGQAMDAIMLMGNLAEGIRLFDQAIRYDPTNGELYHNRGMAYAHMRNWRQALDDFTLAIKFSPAPSSYEQRAAVYVQLGDRQAARRDWEQAYRMNPNRATTLMNLGWLCVEERRFRDAIDFYTRAINAEPTLAAAYANRSKIYYEMGDRAHAFEDLQRARQLVESGADTSNRDTTN
jgi:tetratricopeptide (TPR) repeat protein